MLKVFDIVEQNFGTDATKQILGSKDKYETSSNTYNLEQTFSLQCAEFLSQNDNNNREAPKTNIRPKQPKMEYGKQQQTQQFPYLAAASSTETKLDSTSVPFYSKNPPNANELSTNIDDKYVQLEKKLNQRIDSVTKEFQTSLESTKSTLTTDLLL